MSTEQQISDLALQQLCAVAEKVEQAEDVVAALEQHPSHQPSSQDQVMERIREAAYSIFEQYLSEKVNHYMVYIRSGYRDYGTDMALEVEGSNLGVTTNF